MHVHSIVIDPDNQWTYGLNFISFLTHRTNKNSFQVTNRMDAETNDGNIDTV